MERDMKQLGVTLASLLVLAVTVFSIVLFPSHRSVADAARVSAATCPGSVYYKVQGVHYEWSTEWQVNSGDCQQRSKVRCSNPNHTQGATYYGGWVYSTSIWSGVNCSGAFPLFLRGGYQVRPGPGAPLTTNKWVYP